MAQCRRARTLEESSQHPCRGSSQLPHPHIHTTAVECHRMGSLPWPSREGGSACPAAHRGRTKGGRSLKGSMFRKQNSAGMSASRHALPGLRDSVILTTEWRSPCGTALTEWPAGKTTKLTGTRRFPHPHPQDTNRLVLETVTTPGHGNSQFASSPRWLTLIFCEPPCWNPLPVTHRAIGLLSKPTAVHNRLCRRRPAPGLWSVQFFPFCILGGFAFQPHFPQNTALEAMLSAQISER